MFAKLLALLRPPAFEDEEEQRTANTLYTLLLLLFFGSFMVVIVRLISGELLATAVGFAVVGAVSAFLLGMVRRGSLTLPSYVVPLMLLFALLYLTGNDQGVHDIGMPAFALVIVLAGLMLGRRGVLVFTVLTALGALGLGIAEISGVLQNTLSDLTGYDDLALVVLQFGFIGFVTYVMVNNLQFSLNQARQANEELQALSDSLEMKVTDRTRDLALAAEVGHSISRIRDLDLLLGKAVELIQARFQLYYVQIYLVDEDGQNLVLHAGSGDVGRRLLEQGHSLPIDVYSINGRAVTIQEPVIVSSTRKNPLFRPNPLLPHTNAELAMPLVAGERVVGVLDLQSRDVDSLGEEMLAAFDILAGQLAVAIESARLFTELEEAEQETERERALLRSLINSVPDLIFYKDVQGVYLGSNPAFAEFAGLPEEELTGKTDFDLFDRDVAAFFREQDQAMMERGTARRNEEWVDYPDGRRVLLDTMKTPIYDVDDSVLGLIGVSRDITDRHQAEANLARRVAELNCLNDIGRQREGQLPLPEFLTWTAERIPAAMPYPEECVSAITLGDQVYGHSEALTLPRQIVEGLRIGGELVGRLYITYTDQSLSFADEDSAFIGGVGRRISSYIETQRLLSEIQAQAIEMQDVNEIGATIAAIRHKSQLLKQVVELTQEKFDLYHVQIYLLESDRQGLILRAGSGEIGRQMVAEQRRISLFRRQSMVAQAARTQKLAVAADTTENPMFLPHPLLPDTRSELALPLIAGEELLGVFDVQSNRANYFDTDEQNIFTSLATQITVALQNAEQYEQTQRALDELRALQQAATQKGWGAFLTARRRAIAGYVAQEESVAPIVANGEGSHPDDIVETGSPAHLRDLAESETAVVNPVDVGGATIGKLGVRLPSDRDLTEEEVELLQSISRQVGQALDRARLAEQTQMALTETERRGRELAVLNEMAQTLSTQTTVDNVLAVIYEYTDRLMSSDEFYVAFYDADTDEVVFALAVSEGKIYRNYGRRRAGDGITEYVIRNRQPLLMAENVDRQLEERGIESVGKAAESWIGAPLLFGDRIIGVIALQSYHTPGAYDEQSLKLLTAIASQAAISIENARLIEATSAQARREQMLREITTQVNTAVDANAILRTAAREIGQALDLDAFVYLTGPDDVEDTSRPEPELISDDE